MYFNREKINKLRPLHINYAGVYTEMPVYTEIITISVHTEIPALKEISWSKILTCVGKSSCPQTTQPTLVILTA